MAASQPVAYTIEPFDPERHDRAAFSCGVKQVDNYFQKTANKLAKADNVRLYVMVDPGGSVIGFYALNADSTSRRGAFRGQVTELNGYTALGISVAKVVGQVRPEEGGVRP